MSCSLLPSLSHLVYIIIDNAGETSDLDWDERWETFTLTSGVYGQGDFSSFFTKYTIEVIAEMFSEINEVKIMAWVFFDLIHVTFTTTL